MYITIWKTIQPNRDVLTSLLIVLCRWSTDHTSEPWDIILLVFYSMLQVTFHWTLASHDLHFLLWPPHSKRCFTRAARFASKECQWNTETGETINDVSDLSTHSQIFVHILKRLVTHFNIWSWLYFHTAASTQISPSSMWFFFSALNDF